MPARGALTCTVKLTPGGSVVEVGGEVVGGEVLGATDVAPEVCDDPPPPPHATRSVAMTARATSRARQPGNARCSAPGCRFAGWINDVTVRRRDKRTPAAEAPGVLFVACAWVAVNYPVVRGAAGTATAATAGARAGAAAGARGALGAPAGVGAAAGVGGAGGAGGVTGAARQSPTSPLPCNLKRSSPPAPRNLDPV
jgi:hypothetical protein